MTTQATGMAARVSRSGSGSWRPPGQVGMGLLAGVLVGNVVEGRGAASRSSSTFAQGMAVVLLAAIGLALAGATMLGTVVADASPA
jgi:hypothetical protein